MASIVMDPNASVNANYGYNSRDTDEVKLARAREYANYLRANSTDPYDLRVAEALMEAVNDPNSTWRQEYGTSGSWERMSLPHFISEKVNNEINPSSSKWATIRDSAISNPLTLNPISMAMAAGQYATGQDLEDSLRSSADITNYTAALAALYGGGQAAMSALNPAPASLAGVSGAEAVGGATNLLTPAQQIAAGGGLSAGGIGGIGSLASVPGAFAIGDTIYDAAGNILSVGGTAASAGNGILNTLGNAANTAGNVLGNAANTAGNVLGGGGGDLGSILGQLLSGYGQYRAGDEAADALREAAAAADPFAPYRSQYAQQLNALMADPSSLSNRADYKFQLDQGIKAIEGSAASRGMLNSGNILYDLMNYGQGLASTSFDSTASRLAALAGAGAIGGGANSIAQAGLYNSAGTAGAIQAGGNILSQLFGGGSSSRGSQADTRFPSTTTSNAKSLPSVYSNNLAGVF